MLPGILTPRERWHISLFSKMALVLTPVFLVVAALGLWVIFAQTAIEADNALSMRLGSAAARVAAGFERHARLDTSDSPWTNPLPAELLNTLLSDQAIRCVVFKRSDEAGTTLIAPRGLGCAGQDIDARFSIPLSTGAASTIEVGYDRSEIESQRAIWLHLSILVLTCGLLLSLGAAWLGFRIFINAPLCRLLKSIKRIETHDAFEAVAVDQNDELGTVMMAFNTMQKRDREKTALLELERARFAHVLDSMMDGLLVVGRDMRVLMTNTASSKLLGMAREDILGASILTLFQSTQHTDGASNLSCVEALVADGTKMPALTSVASMRLNQEAATVCVFRDISDAIEREQALHQTTLAALAANRAKTEFLANMSHELRTPLNAIIGFSEIIASGILVGPQSGTASDYAKDINDSGQHLLTLINDILDIAKVETGEIKLYPTRFNLQEIFSTIERVMRAHALQGGVLLEISQLDDDFIMQADMLRVKQILINLVSNAIKFTGQGGTVSVDAWRERNAINISVRDTGIGMTDCEIDEAIKPFRQVDNSHTRHYEGTGLGLTLSKNLTELHGGSLKIRSTPGRGTHVIVILPEAQASSDTVFDAGQMLRCSAC